MLHFDVLQYLIFKISALLERLKAQSKNQIAIIRKNTSQAEKITTDSKWLADENERYAHYLNCLVTAMNNSMSSKV